MLHMCLYLLLFSFNIIITVFHVIKYSSTERCLMLYGIPEHGHTILYPVKPLMLDILADRVTVES